MSWTPYDHEAEERRNSERFADASMFDGPDPSEYMDYPEEEAEFDAIEAEYAKRFPKPGMIDENDVLKGLLGLLFAVLASLMLWILIGTAVMRWILR